MPHKTTHIQFKVRDFRPSVAPLRDPVRAWILSRALRVALYLGFVVVVIGPCRCGKTYLLERTTPGRIIGGLRMRVAAGFKPVIFKSEGLPDALFSIDDSEAFESRSLAQALAAMSGRAFAISIQHHNMLPAIIEDIGSRRFLIVEFESSLRFHGSGAM